jgi:hypothetical protein
MIFNVIWGLVSALLLTIAVEAPVGWLLGLRTWRGQLVLLLANVITNPLLNLIINMLATFGAYTVKSPFDPLLIALECAVVAVEALLLKVAAGKTAGRAIVISIAANASSWLAGALLLWR